MSRMAADNRSAYKSAARELSSEFVSALIANRSSVSMLSPNILTPKSVRHAVDDVLIRLIIGCSPIRSERPEFAIVDQAD